MLAYFLLLLPPLLVELAFLSLRPLLGHYQSNEEIPEIMRRYDIKAWTRLKLYIGAIFLLPPRLMCILLCVVMHWFNCKIVLLLHPDESPITGWKRTLVNTSSRIWARLLIFSVGVWRVNSEGRTSSKACALVANHVSWIDILYFLIDPELPSFLSKDSVKQIPFIGVIATAMQCIFVDRANGKGEALKLLTERMTKLKDGEQYPKIIIYPEGTTTNGRGLMSFKKGAFLARAPVQPVCMIYEGAISPTMEVVPLWVHAVFMMSQVSIGLTVRRLAPVEPREEWSAEEFAEHVRGLVAESMAVPKVGFSYEDKVEYLAKVFNKKVKEL